MVTLFGKRAAALVVLVLTGCTGSAHPSAAEYDAPPSDMTLLRGTATISAVPAAYCIPGTTRECKAYTFQNGHWYCPVTFQICKRSGYGWRKCGDHTPEPEDDTPEADEQERAPEDGADPLIH